MRAVVQRVSGARVLVDETVVGAVGHGLCVLVGIAENDDGETAAKLARKVSRLRVFEDDRDRFNRDIQEVGGAVLAVSQFTLIADTSRGNRPSFSAAARPEVAEPLYDAFCDALESDGIPVARGQFGARMRVEIENEGPVTVVLDT